MAKRTRHDADADRRILTEATANTAKLLGLNNNRLANVIGVSPSTVSRMRRGDYCLDPNDKSWELSLLLVRLFRSLGAIAADDERVIQQWMMHYNRDLNGIPAEQIETVDGLVEVVDYLDAHRARV